MTSNSSLHSKLQVQKQHIQKEAKKEIIWACLSTWSELWFKQETSEACLYWSNKGIIFNLIFTVFLFSNRKYALLQLLYPHTKTPRIEAAPNQCNRALVLVCVWASCKPQALSTEWEETFYKDCFVQGRHQLYVYAANMFMALTLFDTVWSYYR